MRPTSEIRFARPEEVPAVREAIEALRALRGRHGAGVLDLALSNYLSERVATWNRWTGLRPSRRPAVPATAAGRRCRDYNAEHRGYLDHGRAWRSGSKGQPVVTGEPYGLHLHDLEQIIADCRRLDLEATISAASRYWPLATVVVELRQRDTATAAGSGLDVDPGVPGAVCADLGAEVAP